MPDFKKKINILHFCIWILAIVAAGLVANTILIKVDSSPGYHEDSFVESTVYGYLIVSCLLVWAILFDEEIPEKTQYLISGGGALLYLVSAVLLFFCYDYIRHHTQAIIGGRILAAGIICAILGILHLFELLASIFKKELLE